MKGSIFSQAPVRRPKLNRFGHHHSTKTTLDAGYLVPVLCKEVLPSDVISYNNNTMVRMSPMVAPVMHEMDVSTMAFFVPIRLIWDNYDKFFSSPVPDEDTPVAPYFQNVEVAVGSLGDYLGLPTKTFIDDSGNTRTQYTNLPSISALPFAAYNKIYNDWFRDQNVMPFQETSDPVPDKLTDGFNPFVDFVLRKRAWQHDYLTSNLPWAQKGDPVMLPLGDSAPVQTITPSGPYPQPGLWRTQSGSAAPGTGNQYTGASGIGGSFSGAAVAGTSTTTLTTPLVYDPNGTLEADLSAATAITINTLRWANSVQMFLEKNARGGTRYTELIRQHFAVIGSDARLQRAEFLGSSTNPMIISEVLQTSASEADTTPQGEMAGHGMSFGGSRHIRYRSEEHGFFIVLANIRPKTAYQQGLDRMWTRFSAIDYAWPDFAHLGEQEVYNREVYADGTTADQAVWGYQSRYAEYKYSNSNVSGEFRTTLGFWHMGRIFDQRPGLNQTFIECTPTKRIFAVNTPGVHNYYMRVQHYLEMTRPLPLYGVPSL